jgi:hypothetical protein
MNVLNTRREFTIGETISKFFMQSSPIFGALFVYTFAQSVQAATTLVPEQIKSSLLRGSDTQRTEFSMNLNLVIPKRTRVGATADIPCTEYDSVEVSHINLLKSDSQAVIKAFSSSCQYTYFVVLEQGKSGAWRYVQTVSIWSKNKTPRVTFENLITSDEKEVVVQDYETDYGSGISQTNITIWKLFRSGLQIVFDEPSHVIFSVPINKKESENTDQSEDSEFSFVSTGAAKGESPSRKEIVQKQVIRDHQTKITRSWLYVWAPEIQRFQKQPIAEDGIR